MLQVDIENVLFFSLFFGFVASDGAEHSSSVGRLEGLNEGLKVWERLKRSLQGLERFKKRFETFGRFGRKFKKKGLKVCKGLNICLKGLERFKHVLKVRQNLNMF